MTKHFKFSVFAIALAAAALTGTPAEAQRPRGGSGRGLPPPPGTGRLRNAAQGVSGRRRLGGAGKFRRPPVGVQRRSGPRLVVHAQRRAAQRAERGLCLDVNGRAGARGDKLLLWACDGGADQLWSFEAYETRPAPPPPPEQQVPPAPPRPPAMADGPFRALVGNVRSESFSDSQVAVVAQAATRNFFRVGQVKSLIDLVAFSATKLRVLELCAPHIVDGENAFALFDAFAFSADKEQARHILRRHGI